MIVIWLESVRGLKAWAKSGVKGETFPLYAAFCSRRTMHKDDDWMTIFSSTDKLSPNTVKQAIKQKIYDQKKDTINQELPLSVTNSCQRVLN